MQPGRLRSSRDVPTPPLGRFRALDAMRGVAAVLVLLFHVRRSSAQASVLDGVSNRVIDDTLDFSRSGVAIFFVISGFVIAFSTRDLGVRGRDAVRFSARRQVRLDPPYYLTIAVVLVLAALQGLVPGLVAPTYTVREVLLNLLYLQGIAGVPSILGVAWTLCLEVQFYLVVVLLAFASGKLFPGDDVSHRRAPALRTGALTLGAVSLALPFLGVSAGPWFIGQWWMFCFGMVLCWFFLGAISRPAVLIVTVLLGAWCACLDVFPVSDRWQGQWFAWAAGVLILALVASGRTSSAPPWPLLYLGTISYSLYLVHLPIIDTVMAAGFKLTGNSRTGALVFVVLGIVASLLTAHLLYVLVERRSMAWSSAMRTARWPLVQFRSRWRR